MTTLRYEVWVNTIKPIRGWHIHPGGVFESKDAALKLADKLRDGVQACAVEEWDAGRNVFLKTILEYSR